MKLVRWLVKIVLVGVVLVVVTDVVLVTSMAHWQSKNIKADAGIVLGAAINTPALKNRTLTALKLYQEDRVEQLVLSGGKVASSDISEADYMEQVIRYYQDQPTSYIKEDLSTNTYENIKNSQAKIPELKSVVVVSDEFHLARAVLMAKRAGFEEVYWTAPAPDYYSRQELRFYYFREFVAMLSYLPKFILG